MLARIAAPLQIVVAGGEAEGDIDIDVDVEDDEGEDEVQEVE